MRGSPIRVWARTDEDFAEHLLNNRSIDANGCWNWTRSTSRGYGQTRDYYSQKPILVHRLAAHLWLGFDLTSPLSVCHHCDNPPCFNPAHLFIGTMSDNIRDARDKGRLRILKGEASPKAKLTEEAVRTIRAERDALGTTFAEFGRRYGVHGEVARQAYDRRTWAWLD